MDDIMTGFLLLVPVLLGSGSAFTLLLSMPNTSTVFSVGRIAAGALIAIENINSRPDLLPGHQLDYHYVDDECDDLKGPGKIVELQQRNKYSALIGPVCSQVCDVTSKLAAFWNIPVVSPVCADQQFLDKEAYPTLTRVFGPFTKMGSFFVEICKEFGWKQIGIIHGNGTVWTIPAEGIRYQAEVSNITIAKTMELRGNSSITPAQALAEMAEVTRIIVISARGDEVRRFLIEAHKQGLTNGDFVFFTFEPYKHVEVFGNFNWEQGDEHDSVAKQAYQALFLLSLYKPSDEEYTNFSIMVKQRAKQDFDYEYGDTEEVSVFAAIAHDAVWLYAHALNESLAENGDQFNGLYITRKMWNRTITGVQGDVTMDSNGDRESAYMMKHMGNDGIFKVVANYGTNKVYEAVRGASILWPGGNSNPPKDTPQCGFKGEHCNNIDRKLAIAVGLISGLLTAGTLAVCILYRKYRLQEEASMLLWRISPSDMGLMELHPSRVPKVSHMRTRAMQASVESIIGGMDGQCSSYQPVVYKETVCAMRLLHVRSVSLSGELQTELRQCRDLTHRNVCSFIGACLDPPQPFLLTEYCPKGSLQDILKTESIKLDWSFKCSLLLDIVKGMNYLHCSPLHSHGHLTSRNCVVDSRFVLKVTDFGLATLRRADSAESPDCARYHQSLLYRAPELLRQNSMSPNGSQRGDVYSFSIIVQEVVYRRGPFYIPSTNLKPIDIVERVKSGGIDPLRPHTDGVECPEEMEALIKSCWSERPADRPDFSSLRGAVKKLSPTGGSEHFMDDLLSRLEQYACNLEEVVSERTAQLLEEKRRAEGLLTQMLPRSVAAQLIKGNAVQAETYDCVTIYFSDIEGFTAMSATLTPMQVVNVLNDLYTYFDTIIDNHDVYKVETIGDAYMVVSGLPIRNGDGHAKEIARMSLAIVKGMTQYHSTHVPGQQLRVRIGLHSGPCVAGVVGQKMPRYCLFGDTVNTASRMESHGLPLRIHISTSTKALLDTFGTFRYELRGDIPMKGKGLVRTFWLLGEDQ
ncbi:atrial natriuretic peptide receptor 1 [Engraulis encrasicolus]|uniref:atrial natriuretic peptide receptor 1 n=1 Tax=Engraulis encrasicolus TaxID=184585 RepID=UPI002FCE7928